MPREYITHTHSFLRQNLRMLNNCDSLSHSKSFVFYLFDELWYYILISPLKFIFYTIIFIRQHSCDCQQRVKLIQTI